MTMTLRPAGTTPRRGLPPLLTLSEAAVARLRRLYESGEEGRLLRVAVGTKGCSGLSYQMSWVDAPGPGDETITQDGVTVLIDRQATLFLIGTTMDYRETALESGFTFVNPNEKGRCGCGESFHV
jgi:iron-sulfur cluster assembly protein